MVRAGHQNQVRHYQPLQPLLIHQDHRGQLEPSQFYNQRRERESDERVLQAPGRRLYDLGQSCSNDLSNWSHLKLNHYTNQHQQLYRDRHPNSDKLTTGSHPHPQSDEHYPIQRRNRYLNAINNVHSHRQLHSDGYRQQRLSIPQHDHRGHRYPSTGLYRNKSEFLDSWSRSVCRSPVVVNSTDDRAFFASSYLADSFNSKGRTWLFYLDTRSTCEHQTGCLMYTSSTNGSRWAPATTIPVHV